MSAVRNAIDARLKGDATLVALCGSSQSIFHRHAPQTAKPPVVVYSKNTGDRRYFFKGVPLHYETWLIKGIAFGRTADRAEAIGERIEAIMTDLTISGHTCLDVRLESDVDLPEQVGKEIFQHVGGIYRVVWE
jgi:hypothetical protein